jgi:hypothetical protein
MAAPVSTCTNAGGVNTCNLFESDANGNDNEIASQVGTGVLFTTGWLVAKENNGTDTDPANWSDLVLISGAKTIQLISDPDAEKFTFPITINGNVMVTAADVTNGMYNGVKLTNPTVYKLETAPPTVFNPTNAGGLKDTINVFSDAPPPTEPEPAALWLVGIGMIGLVSLARWRRRPSGTTALDSRRNTKL